MNLKFKLTLILLMLLSISFYAQDTYLIKGVVYSEADNSPLPGVSVILLNTVKGTDTDFDGNFSLKVKKGDILQFSSVGFVNKTVSVTGQETLSITMTEDANVLDEVVVVGYGTAKQKNLTSSVSKVSSDVIEKAITPRIDDALRGKVAGVNILSTNGEVGGDTRITIRGTGSISGSSSPLIVVDGLPIGTDPDLLASIDSNNIKSIEVLKDASSTAIYGSRGANGVIIVTLKEGVAGDTKFSYNSYLGVRFAKKNDNFNLSLSEEESRVDNLFNGVVNPTADFTDDYLDKKSELQAQKFIAAAGGGETDWQDYVFPGGTVNSHSFAARGGSELTKFDASVSYIKDEGIYQNDVFERYNARIKINSSTKNKKIKYGLTVNTRFIDQERLPSTFTDALRQGPWLRGRYTEETLALVNPFPNSDAGVLNTEDQVYNNTQIDFNDLAVGGIAFEKSFDGVFQSDGNGGILVDTNGNPIIHPTYEGIQVSSTDNNGPVSFYEERARTKKQFTGFASTYLEFKLTKGLKFKQTLSGNYRSTNDNTFISTISDRDLGDEARRADVLNTRSQLNVESLLTYKRDFGNHSLNALAGFSFDNYNYTFRSIDQQGFSDDLTSNISLADAEGAEVFTQLGQEKLVSYFGRVIYDFDDKYLFSVSARTDGSTRFGPENRYGFFPTASVGWNISNEAFLNDSDFLSNLKLRLSYGISGSNDIDSDIFQSLYRSQDLGTTVSYGEFTGRKLTNLGDETLGWEQLKELNFGVDFGFFNGAVNGSVDLYDKTSEDLILNLQVPSVIGANTQLTNIGQVQNKGVELELSSRLINNDNFSWNISGQFSTNRNEVLSLGGTEAIITASTNSNRVSEWITQVGGPISAFYGYVEDKSNPIPVTEYDPFARFDIESQSVAVVDINGDGLIDEDDRTVLGSPYPDFEWGFSSDFDFYNFDFNFSLQGSHGAERRVGDLGTIRASDFSTATVSGSYRENNFTAPRVASSAHIQDASFVALRNVSLGYNLPKDIIGKMNLDRVRLYVTGENLIFAFAEGYEGFNPESAGTTHGDTNTPTTYGYQRGDGTISRTISVGLNLDF